MNRDVVLLGDGWGAEAAFKGLISSFPNMKVITEDLTICPDSYLMDGDLLTFQDKVLIFAGYKPIVPYCVLQRNLCVNIHYSLLPKYRGLHSTVWAILNDEPELGLTVHEMSRFLDDGPIIHQYKVANDFITTSREYMEQFNLYIEKELGTIIRDYLSGKFFPVQQDKKQATWVGRRKKEDCLIDFNRPISYQKAFFRALVLPYPRPFIRYKGIEYTVTKVAYHKVDLDTHIGRILNIDEDGLWVKCKDGYMILQELLDRKEHVIPFDTFRIGVFLNI